MDIEQELLAIKERNRKVEIDKAWEVSWVRRGFIATFTYAIALAWLLIIHESHAVLKALVPSLGYVLSTLSLPALKKRWVKNNVI